MKIIKVILCIFLLLITLSAQIHRNEDIVVNQNNTGIKNVLKKKSVKSQLLPSDKEVLSEITEFPYENQSLHQIYFLNDSIGWVTTKKFLYKTANGGKTWIKIEFPYSGIKSINKFKFIDKQFGWMLLQDGNDTSYSISGAKDVKLLTTNDGGESWNIKLSLNLANITNIEFIDSNSAWVLGLKPLEVNKDGFTYFVLKTSDSGNNWKDVSDSLVKKVFTWNPIMEMNIPDKGLEMFSNNANTTLIFSNNNKLLKTVNNGETWEVIGMSHKPLTDMGVFQKGLFEDGQIWMSSSLTLNSLNSDLVVQKDNNIFTRYSLNNVGFKDILRLSKKQFIACGSIGFDKKQGDKFFQEKYGIILKTQDGGKNWQTLFQSSEIEVINSITFAQDNFFAIGDNSKIIRVKIKDKD